MTFEVKSYDRKVFTVHAVELTLQNYEKVAEWAGGEVKFVPTKMMGTTAELPTVAIKGTGEHRKKIYTATLGCFVVELKGHFRVYKPVAFWSAFQERKKDELSITTEPEPMEAVGDDPNVTAAWEDSEKQELEGHNGVERMTEPENPYSGEVYSA